MTALARVSFELTGKVAVITGGSRGLGREIAIAYAEHGADVVVASRKEVACVRIADEIRRSTGRKTLGVSCHVGRWDDCDRLVETVYGEFGRVDVLVNNAGSSPAYSSLVEISEDLFDKVVAVNLKGAFRLASVIGSRMAEGEGGSIINITSVAAVEPRPEELPYAAAKAGLTALTRGLSHALGPKVRVNAIMPGTFLTDISKAWDPEHFDEIANNEIPLRRGGEPKEVVGAALYLASDASSYTSGAVIKIDGGWAYASG